MEDRDESQRQLGFRCRVLVICPTWQPGRDKPCIYRRCNRALKPRQTPTPMGFDPSAGARMLWTSALRHCVGRTSATWILAGDIQGFFDHLAFAWLEEHPPLNKRILAKRLRCGFLDHGALYPTTAGVPQGGIISPVISNLVLDGLEASRPGVVSWHRWRP